MSSVVVLVLLIQPACVDTPDPIAAPGTTSTSPSLAGLGVFVGDPSMQRPSPGFVPYDVNVSLYADGAHKYRFVYVPPGTTIHATDGRWDVPIGTIFVKTFYYLRDERDPSLGEQLIETRFLVRTSVGYQVSTYLWNGAQSDAVASGGNVEVPVTYVDSAGATQALVFHVPGTSQCSSCHAGRALGWRTAQIDHAGSYTDGSTNQIDHLISAGVLDARPPPSDALVDPFGTADVEARARSYLDANCGHCHSPEPQSAAAGTRVYWDYADTNAAMLPLCRATYSVDGRNRIIVPGSPDASEMLARMRATDPFERMPLGPSRIPDGAGITVLTDWIAGMTGRCP